VYFPPRPSAAGLSKASPQAYPRGGRTESHAVRPHGSRGLGHVGWWHGFDFRWAPPASTLRATGLISHNGWTRNCAVSRTPMSSPSRPASTPRPRAPVRLSSRTTVLPLAAHATRHWDAYWRAWVPVLTADNCSSASLRPISAQGVRQHQEPRPGRRRRQSVGVAAFVQEEVDEHRSGGTCAPGWAPNGDPLGLGRLCYG
jgi:hypothetical protein